MKFLSTEMARFRNYHYHRYRSIVIIVGLFKLGCGNFSTNYRGSGVFD